MFSRLFRLRFLPSILVSLLWVSTPSHADPICEWNVEKTTTTESIQKALRSLPEECERIRFVGKNQDKLFSDERIESVIERLGKESDGEFLFLKEAFEAKLRNSALFDEMSTVALIEKTLPLFANSESMNPASIGRKQVRLVDLITYAGIGPHLKDEIQAELDLLLKNVDAWKNNPVTFQFFQEIARLKILPHRSMIDGGFVMIQSTREIDAAEKNHLESLFQGARASFDAVVGKLSQRKEFQWDTLRLHAFYDHAVYYDWSPSFIGRVMLGYAAEQGVIHFDFADPMKRVPIDHVLRHEYVHYLQNRYLIREDTPNKAYWLKSQAHLWLLEGLAEYVASINEQSRELDESIRHKIAKNLVKKLSPSAMLAEPQADFGPDLYPSSAVLVKVLHEKHPKLFKTLMHALSTDQEKEYTAAIQQILASKEIQKEYDTLYDSMK